MPGKRMQFYLRNEHLKIAMQRFGWIQRHFREESLSPL